MRSRQLAQAIRQLKRAIVTSRYLLAQFAIVLQLATPAQLASARTWYVMKDGSGDYTVIQDAVDAAASGDVIQIGPGRFEEVQTFQLPGGLRDAHCRPTQPLLTVIGSGVDTTIIGLPNGPATQQSPSGFLTDADTHLYLSDLTVENATNGVQANGPYVSVRNCVFRACYQALDTVAWQGTWVRESAFIGNLSRGIIVYQGLGATNVLIENCAFLGGGISVDLQSQGSTVRNCQFSGQVVGLQLSFGAQATVQACTFENEQNYGVVLTGASHGTLRDNVFSSSAVNLSVQSDSHLTATGNVFRGGSLYTVRFTASTTISFSDNHVLNGGSWSAYFGAASVPTTFDVRNNWWGSTDAEQIDGWIRDDEDGATNVTVLFEPFHGMPVSSESSSFGELKARFDLYSH